MCSRMNPIALALKRVGLDYSVGYREICKRRPATTEDGMAFFAAVHVVDLPESAVGFMRAFGYSLSGKESKRAFETRKALRRTSSDHKTPVKPGKQRGLVKPFEFELCL
jgi:hypothetical protein